MVSVKSTSQNLVTSSRKSSPVKRNPLSGRLDVMSKYFDDSGRVSVDRVADGFGMSKMQLAETIGVKRETIYRAERAQGRKPQARTLEMLEVIARIAGWAGSEVQAMAWYRSEPIPAFGGRTAEALVKDSMAGALRDYLDHIATGGFA